jgi:hypothetical protein
MPGSAELEEGHGTGRALAEEGSAKVLEIGLVLHDILHHQERCTGAHPGSHTW